MGTTDTRGHQWEEINLYNLYKTKYLYIDKGSSKKKNTHTHTQPFMFVLFYCNLMDSL